MEYRISASVVLCGMWLLTLSVVDCQTTRQRVRVLERKFSTRTFEIDLLQLRTQSIEERLEKIENTSLPSTPYEVESTGEPKHTHTVDDDKLYAVYTAFEAEKMERLRLQVKCNKLENSLKQLQISNQVEMSKMDMKIRSLMNFQQTWNQSPILSQIDTNRLAINDLREGIDAKLNTLTKSLNEDSKKKYANIDTEIADIGNKVVSVEEAFDEKLNHLKSNSVSSAEISALVNTAKISFSARLRDSVANLDPERTLVFNSVVTNNGNAYSGSTGIFTAPLDGTYAFYVHILGSDRAMEMRLNKNSSGAMWLYVNSRGHGADGNMVVLQLVKGDKIYVVKNGPYGTRPFYVHPLWTTFSGYLLHAK